MASKTSYSYDHVCAVCTTAFSSKHKHAKTCGYACAGVLRSGEAHYNYGTGKYGAGRTKMANGYIGVRGCGGDRVCKYEHITIAEGALGRRLPAGSVVHHVDGNRANNASGNLVICENQGYHMLLHKRARVLAAGKVPGRHMYCSRCKTWLSVWRFSKHVGTNTSDWCKLCRRSAMNKEV